MSCRNNKKPYRVAIITASDKGARGERTDASGALIEDMCQAQGMSVVSKVILPDNAQQLRQEMMRIADTGLADLILTTGGTGLSPTDCTPEATLAVADRIVPGIPEAMRFFSLQTTKKAMLSRAAAVVRKQTLIINLPGSVRGVRENLAVIIDELPHALGILTNADTECGQP